MLLGAIWMPAPTAYGQDDEVRKLFTKYQHVDAILQQK